MVNNTHQACFIAFTLNGYEGVPHSLEIMHSSFSQLETALNPLNSDIGVDCWAYIVCDFNSGLQWNTLKKISIKNHKLSSWV